MSASHTATPEQWAILQDWARALTAPTENCVLELRARVEALEANSKPSPNFPQIGSSLAKRVQHAIYIEYARSKGVGCPEARSAIREVAAWLREQQDGDLVAAAMLEQEAER